jgi:hypothetical protein
MLEAKRDEDWDHSSYLIAALVNSNPFRGGKPVQPGDFHPYRKASRQIRMVLPKGEMLTDVFRAFIGAANQRS